MRIRHQLYNIMRVRDQLPKIMQIRIRYTAGKYSFLLHKQSGEVCEGLWNNATPVAFKTLKTGKYLFIWTVRGGLGGTVEQHHPCCHQDSQDW